jgi:hypothetical protein
MVKKIVLIAAVLAVVAVAALHVAARKAPELLREAISRSLGKPVDIRAIRYHFPDVFELEGVAVREAEPFAGETSFEADRIVVRASPVVPRRRELVLDRVTVDGPVITVRKYRDDLYHALSAVSAPEAPRAAAADGVSALAGGRLPLEIRDFRVTRGHFRYVDYDVQQDGFVIALENISADVHNIELPQASRPTRYRVDAALPQGRDEKAAMLRADGWTHAATLDTQAQWNVEGVFLPYFRPYYAQITQASIEQGYLDSRGNLEIRDEDLTANAELGVLGLHFGRYENGDELFGLKAEEILAFLKDSSGRLKLQLSIRWNLADRGVKPRDVIRRAIERSLKSTILGNVGVLLENTINRINEKGLSRTKDDLEGTLKKVKELLR